MPKILHTYEGFDETLTVNGSLATVKLSETMQCNQIVITMRNGGSAAYFLQVGKRSILDNSVPTWENQQGGASRRPSRRTSTNKVKLTI